VDNKFEDKIPDRTVADMYCAQSAAVLL